MKRRLVALALGLAALLGTAAATAAATTSDTPAPVLAGSSWT